VWCARRHNLLTKNSTVCMRVYVYVCARVHVHVCVCLFVCMLVPCMCVHAYVCACAQVKYQNEALIHFGTSNVVPVYYITFTTITMSAGMVLFLEISFNPIAVRLPLFVAGLMCAFGGVYLINQLKEDTAQDHNASGLKWENVGGVKPAEGLELSSSTLADTLQSQTQFTQAEWDEFGVEDLRHDSFIKAGDSYFKPAQLLQYPIGNDQGEPILDAHGTKDIKAGTEFSCRSPETEKENKEKEKGGTSFCKDADNDEEDKSSADARQALDDSSVLHKTYKKTCDTPKATRDTCYATLQVTRHPSTPHTALLTPLAVCPLPRDDDDGTSSCVPSSNKGVENYPTDSHSGIVNEQHVILSIHPTAPTRRSRANWRANSDHELNARQNPRPYLPRLPPTDTCDPAETNSFGLFICEKSTVTSTRSIFYSLTSSIQPIYPVAGLTTDSHLDSSVSPTP